MSIQDQIKSEITSQDVVLFMKGTPQFPMCGFSGQVVQILDYVGAPYKGINVLDWPTIPQLYIKGEFIGGCDIVREMFQSGELQTYLQDHGIAVKAPAQS